MMFTLDRRRFLGGLAATASLPLTARLTFASQTAAPDRRFVLVVLRGAADGLGLVVPVMDADYAAARQGLAFKPGQIEMLDDFYGVNPGFADIMAWYRQREVLFVHAVATQYRERSHFDAQAVLETGRDDPKRVTDGWLARTMTSTGAGNRALAIGGGTPTVLAGAPNVMTWAVGRTGVPDAELIERLALIYDHSDRFTRFGPEIRKSAGLIENATGMGGAPGSAVTQAFATAGRLLSADGGPGLAVISTNGWDTHNGQGLENGRLYNAAKALSSGLVTFRQELSPDLWSGTTILVVSEFGRTVAMNGNRGTDHGTGGVAMLAGGAVAGGRVVADWPGLSKAALYENRDLAPTLDTRALIKAVLREQLDVPDKIIDTVSFPGSSQVKPARDLFRS